jgi:hypothetical protein
MNHYLQNSVTLRLKNQNFFCKIRVKKCEQDAGIEGGEVCHHTSFSSHLSAEKVPSLVECDTVSLSELFWQYEEL